MNERVPRQEQNYNYSPQENLRTELPIQYTSPAERSLEEMPQHAFELVEDGEVVGGAEVDYFSRPLPLYQLTDLWVDNDYAGQGNASRIMNQVEEFLRERGKPGMLVDAIVEGSPAHGMYERRGWESVPDNPSLRVYNWPPQVPMAVLKGYAMRQTPMADREGFATEPIN